MQQLAHLNAYSIAFRPRIPTTNKERSWPRRIDGSCSAFASLLEGRSSVHVVLCGLAAGRWGMLGCAIDQAVNRCFATTFVPFFANHGNRCIAFMFSDKLSVMRNFVCVRCVVEAGC